MQKFHEMISHTHCKLAEKHMRAYPTKTWQHNLLLYGVWLSNLICVYLFVYEMCIFLFGYSADLFSSSKINNI